MIIIYFAISFTVDNDPNKLSKTADVFLSKTKPLQKINQEFLDKPVEDNKQRKRDIVLNLRDNFSIIDNKEAHENEQRIETKTKGPEVTHVAFLKVHKTASSTAQNVFLRFGDERNLSFILAHTKGESGWLNVISYNNTITPKNIVSPPKGGHFDLLCNHVIYNRQSFERVLPKDTEYVGIVREPISRFQSAIKYFCPGFILKILGDTPLLTYSKDPLKYEPNDPRKSQTNNRMAVEFGFPEKLFPGQSQSESKSEINKYLQKIDAEFKFIIISERFAESMVLMKRLLNWSAKDVLYLDQNVAKSATNPRKVVPEEAKSALRNFLNLDIALYKFAIDRFNKQVKAGGDDFQAEVAAFKVVRHDVKDFCSSNRFTMTVKANKWDEGFEITKKDCALYHKHEKDLIQKQRMRMYGTYNN